MPPSRPIEHPPGARRGAGADRERLGPGLTLLSAILGALGLAGAMAAVGTAAYALSAHPDTTPRSVLVEGAAVWILIASLLLSVFVGALRPTAFVRAIGAHSGALLTSAALGLAIVIASVWRYADTYVCCNPDSLTEASPAVGGLALTVFLVTLALRRPLYAIAAAAGLSGVLAVVASTLPPP